MSPLQISWKSLKSKPLSSGLNILLIAFGTGILTILLLASRQIGDKLTQNSKDIDLVVGAKGSPLQLILSSIYYMDNPTGNIPLEDAQRLSRSPFVKRAVPLAMGDNYKGFRIIGTDSNYIALYQLKNASGQFWKKDFEVSIGASVAEQQQLKIGDTFLGAHGLTENTHVHDHHAYKVTGILQKQGNVTDNLILTNIASVWKMHEEPQHDHADENEHEHAEEEPAGNREITSLLIQYRSPMSVVMFPRMVNSATQLQAASPAMESTRLFSLIGVGIDTLQWFAFLIMLIAAVSVFVNLYNSLKERQYDLAIMRTLGASRIKLFRIVIEEGLLLTLTGTIAGILLGHIAVELIGSGQESSQARLSGLVFLKEEIYLFAAGLAIGIFAAIIPAWQAYRADIAAILAKN
ncbi:ABC transporter permease [Pedobacter antarcticus 4BY]|uniref:ABC transporter permease n=2 Tax=Pedobacter antarcticus TaxID=34086 RepID=A0A081PL74_9SPHI|nr:FtsX-like permease family protein [Pedobacter antarcticus]KEQ31447.1 ABC transporter permease [Pedobacter antarcticus 4BY]SFE90603.1 putative ABC transport system permease protein [Pedobacter antarcticus]